MAKARAIAKRRQTVRNIRKITHTMQLIATSRYKRALTRATASRPYTEKITELVAELSAAGRQVTHPLLDANAGTAKTALLVLTSNRGMCGGYNAGVLRLTMSTLDQARRDGLETDAFVVGKKGTNYFKFLRLPLTRSYGELGDTPRYEDIEPIANAFMDAYRAREYDTIRVAYTRFVSASRQVPDLIQLLPIERAAHADSAAPGARVGAVEYEYSPEPAKLLAELLPVTVRVRLFQCFLDANISEQVARMVAMRAATDAAEETIKLLTRQFNRARQSQITMELLDIIGGAEAIK